LHPSIVSHQKIDQASKSNQLQARNNLTLRLPVISPTSGKISWTIAIFVRPLFKGYREKVDLKCLDTSFPVAPLGSMKKDGI